jgi:hypothetical protein
MIEERKSERSSRRSSSRGSHEHELSFEGGQVETGI